MNAGEWASFKQDDEAVARKRAYDRARYVKRRGSHREKQARWRNSIAGRAWCLLRSAQARAKKRGLECTLTHEWLVERLERGTCEMSGLPFVFTALEYRKDAFAPSIDRLDNRSGYTPENCRMILWAINAAIADFGEDTYLRIADRCLRVRQGAGH